MLHRNLYIVLLPLICHILSAQTKTVTKRDTKCNAFEFKCANGVCITDVRVCDGIADCSDNSDETAALCQNVYCPKYGFQCNYGACVSGKAPCNKKKECFDNSDELESLCKPKVECKQDQFTCKSGECISKDVLCDGMKHCKDGSDETEAVCLNSFCPSFGFRCAYGACVRGDSKCNKVKNCHDNSDENAEVCPQLNLTFVTSIDPVTTASTITTAPPLDSCLIPTVNYGKAVNVNFGDNYKAGDFVEEYEVVKIVCNSKYNLLLVQELDNEVICTGGLWNKRFPKCQKLCAGVDIAGRSIVTTCERNGSTIPCVGPQVVGTQALVKCKSGYKLPDRTGLQSLITCLDTGEWDYTPFRCNPICGLPTPQAVPFVVKGKDAQILEVPWQVAIYRNKTLICGGSILTERIVISAAHCFFEEEPEGIVLLPKEWHRVVVGKYYRELNATEKLQTQILNLAEIRSVPGYDGYAGHYAADMSILILDGYIDYKNHIAPVCIDYNLEYSTERVVPSGWVGFISGWGFTSLAGNASQSLKKISMPVVEFATCKTEAPSDYRPFITPDKYCAGYRDGSGVCQGDSGGGMVFPRTIADDQVYYLRGIVSNGRQSNGGCDLGFYTMFTNVQEYISHIKTAVREFPSI